MLEFLLLLTLFVRPVYSAILLIFGIGTEQLPLAIVYVFVAVIDFLFLMIENLFRHRVREKFWIAVLVVFVILVLQVVTGLQYDGLKDDYLSSVLSFASLSITAFLFGYSFVQKNKYKKLGQVLPFFIIVISTVVLYADFSTLNSWDGLVHSKIDYNVDYQNCTYYAAYAFGMTCFYLLYGKELEVGKLAISMRWFFMLLLPIQMFVIVTAGGRGGFLLGAFLAAYFLTLLVAKYRKTPGYYLWGIVVIFMVVSFLSVYLAENGDNIRGFARVTSFLEKPEDQSRMDLYGEAIAWFWKRPVFGNGVGAVWLTVGYYSHNIFCDLLCETGIVGTGFFASILGVYGWKSLKMINENGVHQFSLLIFLFVFVMLIFSGYYLSEPMLWFALAYTFFAPQDKSKVKNENLIR